MKRVLVLGSRSMFGHLIAGYLISLERYKVTALYDLINNERYETYDFDVIINCDICLPRECTERMDDAICINSLLPHELAHLTKTSHTKIIQLSTNCVFDGRLGSYSEEDTPNAVDWYGKTRTMGELHDDKNLTIRLSEIGPELTPEGSNLFNWFMQQEGTVQGYDAVFWNGLTSLELAKQLVPIIEKPKLCGVLHLGTSHYITKYELLKKINEVFSRDCILIPDHRVQEDKTLHCSRSDYIPTVSSYDQQLRELQEYIENHKEIYRHYW